MADTPHMTNAAKMTVFERGAYVIVVGAIAGLLGWIGISVTDGREATARLEVKVEGLSDQVAELKDKLDGSPARRDLQTIDDRIADHESRIRALEQQLRLGRP